MGDAQTEDVDRLIHRRRVLPRWHAGPAALLAAGVLAAVSVVLVVQSVHLDDAVDVSEPLTAGYAKPLVLGYSAVVCAGAVAAAVLPRRRLGLLVTAAGIVGAILLVATLGPGGQLGSFMSALLTLTACWQVGVWTLRAIRTPLLAEVPAVAWLAGIGVTGLALLAAGRAGLLSAATAAAPVGLLGVLGGTMLVRDLVRGGARSAWSAATSTRVGAAGTAVCVLMSALALVWAAAPELGADALYYKSWLPEEWARTGQILPLLKHPVLNFFGFAQIIAIPGHEVDADAVGRYLEWLLYGLLAGTVWWGARRSPWAPVAAAVVMITPQLFWEATTAYDDIFLTLGGVATAVAVLRLLEAPAIPPLAGGLAVGVLAAACLNLKIHIAPLAAGIALGWLVSRGRASWRAALGGVAIGALVFAVPPFALRWVDTGNPVLPSYNALFHSPYWLPQNSGLGFPRLEGYGPLRTLWATIAETGSLESWAPIGALGLLTVAIAVALLTCWGRKRFDRRVVALWIGLLVASGAWYVEFRSTRYALPAGTLAVLLIAVATGRRGVSHRAELAALGVLAAVAALLWPSTVSQFYYVPARDIPWQAAIGLVADRDYEDDATHMREAVAAFDRIAPPRALAATDPAWRAWLSHGRDFTPYWELDVRVRIVGPPPKDPAETLARVRDLGVEWVLDYRGTSRTSHLSRLPYLESMVEDYGEPVWRSPYATLYRLSEA